MSIFDAWRANEERANPVEAAKHGISDNHLMQDLDSGLSKALAADPNARQHAREAAATITATRHARAQPQEPT
jgi:hypothetical protein